MAISPDGLVAQCRAPGWGGCRANVGVLQGRHYYEVYFNDEGLSRVGWSTKSAKLDLGKDSFGYGYGGTGKKSNNNQFDEYGGPFGKGDVVGCYLDCGSGTISFSVNGAQSAFDCVDCIL